MHSRRGKDVVGTRDRGKRERGGGRQEKNQRREKRRELTDGEGVSLEHQIGEKFGEKDGRGEGRDEEKEIRR